MASNHLRPGAPPAIFGAPPRLGTTTLDDRDWNSLCILRGELHKKLMMVMVMEEDAADLDLMRSGLLMNLTWSGEVDGVEEGHLKMTADGERGGQI